MRACRRRIGLTVCSAIAVGAVCLPVLVPMPRRLVFNPSESAPRGWYWIATSDGRRLHVDDFVLASLPRSVAALAAQRGYLPADTPVLKRVGAVAGDFVCVRDGQVRVNHALVAAILPFDRMHRGMPLDGTCRRLAAAEFYLLSSTSGASFDSRYFGAIEAYQVIGRARPLWVWNAP